MFEKGKVYKHLCAKDLDILVLNEGFEDSNMIKLKIAYLFKCNRQVLCVDNIIVLKNEFKYWSEVVYEE